MGKKLYVVINGLEPGIYKTWPECKRQVDNFPNAKFKGFMTQEEADEYIKTSASYKTGLVTKRQHESDTTNTIACKRPKIVQTESTKPIEFQFYAKTGGKDETKVDLLRDPIDENRVCVYTDGSCRTTKKGSIAGYGVYWGKNSKWNIGEKYIGVQTNNRAEIAAVISAVETANKNGIGKLRIITDSQFTINCMTKWIGKWKRNNWMTSGNKEALCRDVLEKLDNIINNTKMDIVWEHVNGHAGNPGNEAADKLANLGADQWLQ